MKFGIDMGHNAPPDVGASGIKQEDNLTKEVGSKVIDKLKSLGYEAINCTPTQASSVIDSVRKRVQIANSQGVQAYVSIHFNSFNRQANGTEVFAVSDAGRKLAQPVKDNLVALGFVDRGVKNGSHLYVLKNTYMPGILIECCFIDSVKDMGIYDSEKVANAIVKGLTGKDPAEEIDTTSQVSPETEEDILKLQQILNTLRIPDSNGRELVEDGSVGPATESATKKFNEIMGIGDTGRATAITWNAIGDIIAKPTLRPNHAEGFAVKYIEYRVGAEIDGVYDANTVDATRAYQAAQGLEADGIVGAITWDKLIGERKIPLAIKMLRDTVLKQQPIDSSEISDPLHKYGVKEGVQLVLESWTEEGNHVKVVLADETFNDFNTWYAFSDHIEIWKDGAPLQQEPEEEMPKTANRTDAFKLPGFASTFYLNDPIVPDGHFYWREALHGGQRIPKSRAHVNNIVALARRLEEVREKLGGRQITITSWYRPEPWNTRAGGAPFSRHKGGEAVDMLVAGMTGRQMASILSNWSGGMGIYRHYPNLLHLDIRPYRARWGGA